MVYKLEKGRERRGRREGGKERDEIMSGERSGRGNER